MFNALDLEKKYGLKVDNDRIDILNEYSNELNKYLTRFCDGGISTSWEVNSYNVTLSIVLDYIEIFDKLDVFKQLLQRSMDANIKSKTDSSFEIKMHFPSIFIWR